MSRAQELASEARGAIRSAASTAGNAYVDEMVRRADEWIAELERLAADGRDALDEILSVVEDANQPYERIAVGYIARRALEAEA